LIHCHNTFYIYLAYAYRLPVGSLYLDIFQKIKALGFNGVSFYTDWALLEGQPGVFNSASVFDFQPFFDAASEAGVFLLARPGPYINAEVSGGGFPGWCVSSFHIISPRTFSSRS